MKLQEITSVLKVLTNNFLDNNIEVLKDLILLYKEGKTTEDLKNRLIQENKYNNKQIKTLVNWAVEFSNSPKELEYLFSDRAITQNNSISPASLKIFLTELKQGFMSLKDQDLEQQRIQIKRIGLGVTRIKAIIDNLYNA